MALREGLSILHSPDHRQAGFEPELRFASLNLFSLGFKKQGVNITDFQPRHILDFCTPGDIDGYPLLGIGLEDDPDQVFHTVIWAKDGVLYIVGGDDPVRIQSPKLRTDVTRTAGHVLAITGKDSVIEPVYNGKGLVHTDYPDFRAFEFAYDPLSYSPGKYFIYAIGKSYPTVYDQEALEELTKAFREMPLIAQALDAAVVARRKSGTKDDEHGIFYKDSDIFSEFSFFPDLSMRYSLYERRRLSVYSYWVAALDVAHCVFPCVGDSNRFQGILNAWKRYHPSFEGDQERMKIFSRTDPQELFRNI